MGGSNLMGFADELLDQAYHLLYKDGGDPKEASLRRAVSTAYYALFHLLIDEAVGNKGIARQRSVLARTFDHAKMKSVCEAYVASFYKVGGPGQPALERIPARIPPRDRRVHRLVLL